MSKEKTKKISPTPVLLGGDLNCYNVARAFHEEYGVTSYAFGRYVSAPTKYSRLVKFQAVENLDTDEVMLQVLSDFRDKHKDEHLILFACNDEYSDVFARIKEKLPEFVFPYPEAHLRPTLSRKAEFYEICDKYGVPHPKTFVVENKVEAAEMSPEMLGFEYPIVIKPSSSIAYWQHPFDGMDKVFFAKNPNQAAEIVNKIFDSGYDDKVVIQETIAGTDANMRVLTLFSDANAKVRAMCLGNTMIEEHVPSAIGNHAAIVTEKLDDFPQITNIVAMLEDLHYTGFSNFDIKLREGTVNDFNVFEINLRQGRSNYYATASGMNVAKLATEVYNSEGTDVQFFEEPHFWHHVPRSIAYKYCENEHLVAMAKRLESEDKITCSLTYSPDLKLNPKRRAIVWAQMHRQHKKFKQWYPKR